jgi:hypothetical protein
MKLRKNKNNKVLNFGWISPEPVAKSPDFNSNAQSQGYSIGCNTFLAVLLVPVVVLFLHIPSIS